MVKALLRLPQSPPRHTGGVVVLVMVTEKITAYKGPEMIFLKASGFVLVARFMTVFMRNISSEIEQLKGGQNTRDGPEKNEIIKGENQA
mgnify:CR=1 FL=1